MNANVTKMPPTHDGLTRQSLTGRQCGTAWRLDARTWGPGAWEATFCWVLQRRARNFFYYPASYHYDSPGNHYWTVMRKKKLSKYKSKERRTKKQLESCNVTSRCFSCPKIAKNNNKISTFNPKV